MKTLLPVRGGRGGELFRGVTVRNRYYDPDVFEVKKVPVSISLLDCDLAFQFCFTSEITGSFFAFLFSKTTD